MADNWPAQGRCVVNNNFFLLLISLLKNYRLKIITNITIEFPRNIPLFQRKFSSILLHQKWSFMRPWPKTFSFPLLLCRDGLQDIYASYRAYKLRNQEHWNKKGSFKAFRNVDTSINLPYLANLVSLTSALRTFQFPQNYPSACVLLTIYACVNPVGQSAIRSYLSQVPEAKGASRSTQEGHSNTEESQKRKGKACGRLMKSLKFWIYFENLDWNTVIKTTTEGTFFFKTVSSPFQTKNFFNGNFDVRKLLSWSIDNKHVMQNNSSWRQKWRIY